ncbi:MAG: glycosyltransferase [Planctomycetota bacterium]|jgi:GT2 family glycosyltransferase
MNEPRLPSDPTALPETLQLSVVVPTHGRPAQVERLLRSLAEQTLPAEAFEVIVVDDGGQPALTFDVGSVPYRCRLTHQTRRGPASARNVGLALAAGPTVLLLTDDTVPASDLLERHVAAHRELDGKTAVLGTFRFTEEARRAPFTQLLDQTDLFQQFSSLRDGERHGWPFFWTANLSAPIEVFLAVGGFDEVNFDQPLCEGLDLGLRLEQQGVGVVHRADCVAHHDHGITVESYFERAFQLGRYQLRLGKKVGAPDVFFEEGTVTADGLRPDLVDLLEEQRAGSEAIVEELQRLEAGGEIERFTPEQAAEVSAAVSQAIQYPRLCGLYFEHTGVDVRQVSREGAPAGTTVSVIAVSCNALSNTQRCIESLRRAADPRYPQEILIVDNGSTDGSAEWLEAQDDIRLIRNPYNFGAPRARNQAIREATGDWVAFLDNDVFVPEGWLDRALYHGAVDPGVGSIPLCANRASKHQVVEYHGSDSQDELQRFADQHFASAPRRGMDSVLFTSLGVLVRAEALERIGGFDEAFSPWGFEDDDIALRVRLSGWRNRVARDTFVYHAFYDGPAKVERHNGWMEQNWRAFLDKWCPAAAGSPLFDYSRVRLPQLGEATEAQLRFDLPAADAAPPTWPGAEHPAQPTLKRAVPAASSAASMGEDPSRTTSASAAQPSTGSTHAGSNQTGSTDTGPAHTGPAHTGPAAAGAARDGVVVVGATEAAIEAARELLGGVATEGAADGGQGVPEAVAISEFLLSATLTAGTPLGRLQQRFNVAEGPVDFTVEGVLRERMDGVAAAGPLPADPRLCTTLPAWRPSLGTARFVCVFDDPAAAADETLRTLVRVPEYGGVALDFDGAAELWRSMYRRVLEEHAAEGEWLFIHVDQLRTAEGRERLEAFTGRPLQPSPLRAVPGAAHVPGPVRPAVAETYRALCARAGYGEAAQEPTSPTAPLAAGGNGIEISVVVTGTEDRDALRRCVAALGEQSAAGRFEVVVVSGVERDEPLASELGAWAPTLDARLVATQDLAAPAARNAGLQAASADLVLLLDGDCVPAPDLVERHLVAHGETGPDRAVVGAVAPAASGGTGALVRALAGAGTGHLPAPLDPTRLHDWTAFHGCNVSLSREALLSVGGFAEGETFAAAADLEVGFRLQDQAGVRVVHREEARVEHRRGWTFEALRQWTRDRAAAELQLMAVHPAAGRHRDWRERVTHTATLHDQLIVQTLPDRARAEAFAAELSRVDLGAFERTGAEGVELATAMEHQLREYVTELAHLWRAEGELSAMRSLGVEVVEELIAAPAGDLARELVERAAATGAAATAPRVA